MTHKRSTIEERRRKRASNRQMVKENQDLIMAYLFTHPEVTAKLYEDAKRWALIIRGEK